MNRYTWLFMATSAFIAGHAIAERFALFCFVVWGAGMICIDLNQRWGNKSIGQIMAERREQKP